MADEVVLTADERAAIRAYLQRSDVRLSTLHRVATALLSGAGLLVLLPAVSRDSVVGVMRALVAGDLDLVHLVLAGAVVAVVALPIVALWLLLRDLTRFYFHANHIGVGAVETFTPRFTLTALRLPADELGAAATAALERARRDPRTIELLVPANDESRRRTDRQIEAYGGLGVSRDDGDAGRATALFELAASRSRTLVEEVAKVEHGMARHLLRLQVIVLRYVKALLALLTTALATFAANAVVEGEATVGAVDEVWIAAIVLAWAPAIVLAVSSPVRWLEKLFRSEGAAATAVGRDPELTHVERIAVRIAGVAWLLAVVAMVAAVVSDGVTRAGRTAGWSVLGASMIALVAALNSSRVRELVRMR